MSTLSKATLDAIAAAVASAIAQANVAPATASSRSKTPKDARPMAARREAAVGGECAEHGKRFATAAGARWHQQNIAHKA